MSLDEMRELKKEISQKRKLHEANQNEKGKEEFKKIVNESKVKKKAIKRQSAKGIKPKKTYLPGLTPGRLSFFAIVSISILSISVFIPFEFKKVFQNRHIQVGDSESSRIAEFSDQVLHEYRTGGFIALKSKWPPNISRFVVERSRKKMETLAGKDDFKIKEIKLDSKTSCYSVHYESQPGKLLTMKISKLNTGGLSLTSIQ